MRMRKKIGLNEFSDTTPSGQPDEDYMEPFRGFRGMKHLLAIYLMKLVPAGLTHNATK